MKCRIILSSFQVSPQLKIFFSKLFIDIRKNDEENLLSVTRKQHNKEKQIYVSMGFADKTDFEFCDDREAVIPRNSDIFHPNLLTSAFL